MKEISFSWQIIAPTNQVLVSVEIQVVNCSPVTNQLSGLLKNSQALECDRFFHEISRD